MGDITTVDEFGRVRSPGAKTGPRELAKALGAPSRVVTPREGNPRPNQNPNDEE